MRVDVDDQHRLEPVRAGSVESRHVVVERAVGPRESGHQLGQHPPLLATDAAPDATSIHQPGRGRLPHEQRSEAVTRALLRPPSAHDVREPVSVGELQPVRAALVEGVARAELLAHDALQPLLERGRVQHRPIVVGRWHLPGAAVVDVEQLLAARLERLTGEVDTVQAQQVEGHERHGQLLDQPRDAPHVADVQAFLQHSEVGDAVAVESDDLAVYQRVPLAQRRVGDVRPGRRDVVVVATGQPGASVAGVGEDPHAVPLHLVGPPIARGHVVALGGEHGTHEDHPARAR